MILDRCASDLNLTVWISTKVHQRLKAKTKRFLFITLASAPELGEK